MKAFNKPTTPLIILGCDALFGAMNCQCSALFSEILSSEEDLGQTNIAKAPVVSDKMLGMLCSCIDMKGKVEICYIL